jgi:hypothetical protein
MAPLGHAATSSTPPDGGLKAEAAHEKPADDGQQEKLPHGGRHDGPGLTGDPPEIVGRQLHPGDDHREKDQDRHAGIHDGLQQGTTHATRTDPAAGRQTERAGLPPQDPVLPCFSCRDRDCKRFRRTIPLERMGTSATRERVHG